MGDKDAMNSGPEPAGLIEGGGAMNGVVRVPFARAAQALSEFVAALGKRRGVDSRDATSEALRGMTLQCPDCGEKFTFTGMLSLGLGRPMPGYERMLQGRCVSSACESKEMELVWRGGAGPAPGGCLLLVASLIPALFAAARS